MTANYSRAFEFLYPNHSRTKLKYPIQDILPQLNNLSCPGQKSRFPHRKPPSPRTPEKQTLYSLWIGSTVSGGLGRWWKGWWVCLHLTVVGGCEFSGGGGRKAADHCVARVHNFCKQIAKRANSVSDWSGRNQRSHSVLPSSFHTVRTESVIQSSEEVFFLMNS